MKPVFLVSLPRSGSTLVQAILEQHPDIITRSEPWVQLAAAPYYRPDLIQTKFSWDYCLEAMAGDTNGCSCRELMADAVKDVIRKYYLSCKGERDARFFVDKTPRYYLILEDLYTQFPEAKFIILTRDLASVVLSMKNTWYQHKSFIHLEKNAVDLVEGPKLLSGFQNKFGCEKNVFCLSYESIVSEPLVAFGNIFEFLDLNFDSNYLHYAKGRAFSGKYGDPKGKTQKTLRRRELQLEQDFKEIFRDRGWAQFARGLEAFHQSEGRVPSVNPYWKGVAPTGEFRRFKRRFEIGGGFRVPGLKETLILLSDRLLDWRALRGAPIPK